MPALSTAYPRVLTDAVRIASNPERYTPSQVRMAQLVRMNTTGRPPRQLEPRPTRKAVA
jgi:hypothetical protein